ncbi:MAG: hypothetical protein NC114_03255 [Ruminococcus flavefaciens]|nr:hypothetical protein [Ruminococcus flavefaciens]
MKTKKMIAAEPEPVYGRRGIARGCLVQYVVPAKDKSFVEDLAKVRGWELPDIKKEKNLATLKVAKTKSANAKVSPTASIKVTNRFAKQRVSKAKGGEYKPNACTIKAMADARAGRVFHAKSPKDLIKQILG